MYSLGVVLYELLAGRRPHDLASQRPDAAFKTVLETDPMRPSLAASRAGDGTRATTLAGDLDAIVMMALRKEPNRRYASAARFSDDIGAYLDRRPVVARGEAVSYRAIKFVRRHRLGVTAAAAIVLSLIGGLAATAWQARVAQRQRVEADAQRARAERRFADVRRLANSFLFEFHDAIAPLPGSTPARKLVVGKALSTWMGWRQRPPTPRHCNWNWRRRTTASATCRATRRHRISEIRPARSRVTGRPSGFDRPSPPAGQPPSTRG